MDGIDHIIVLMLENRSFDHMLGLLDHPKKDEFPEAFLAGHDTRNPTPGGPDVEMKHQDSGVYMTDKEPGHSHKDVMSQMFHHSLPGDPTPGMRGFAWNYVEEHRSDKPEAVMRAYSEAQAPVINKLARHFQLCTNWFCSVPGQTWPNRFFAMAGESAGRVNIDVFGVPFELPDAIFPILEKRGVSWKIYHDGPCLALLIKGMLEPGMKKGFRNLDNLIDDIRNKQLPAFSWVEPDHFGKDSSSQHPGYMDENHDAWGFTSADNLIGRIYDTLKMDPEQFRRTLFVVTYDEHGGLYDHVSPPDNFPRPYPGHIYRGQPDFTFEQLGPRVPALLINPRIKEGSIDNTSYDHAAIVKMVAQQFLEGTDGFRSARVTRSRNPAANLVDSGELDNLPEVTGLVPNDRPPDWQLRQQDRIDRLQLSLMKALSKLAGGFGALARIATNKALADSEEERSKALLAYYIAVHEGSHVTDSNLKGIRFTAVDEDVRRVDDRRVVIPLRRPGDSVVDVVHDVTDSLLGKRREA